MSPVVSVCRALAARCKPSEDRCNSIPNWPGLSPIMSLPTWVQVFGGLSPNTRTKPTLASPAPGKPIAKRLPSTEKKIDSTVMTLIFVAIYKMNNFADNVEKIYIA